MSLLSYSFTTEGITWPAEITKWPLWYQSESNNFEPQEAYWLDYQIEVQEVPTAEGTTKVLRRYQTHFYPSPTHPPELVVSLKEQLGIMLVWYSHTVAYQQNEAPTYTPQLEREALNSGTINGRGYRRFWSAGDQAYQTTLINIRYDQRDYKGEPTKAELALLLEQKTKIAPAVPPPVKEVVRSAIDNPEPQSAQIDVRAYRPITPETVSQIPISVIQQVTPQTPTIDSIVIEAMDELLEKPEVGTFRTSAIDSKQITELPSRSDANKGVNLFNDTIEKYKSGVLSVLPTSPLN